MSNGLRSERGVLGIPFTSAWWRHGVWSLLEHAVTRAADIAVSFALIRVLAPDRFSKLALAQAAVAPLLIFFLSPSSALARDFPRWKAVPGELARNLRSFRHYGWLQGLLGVVMAAAIAWLRSTGWDDFGDRFWPLLWAFGMVLAPVVSTADRDFLRMDLQLRAVNRLNALQKFGTLVASLGVIFVFGARFDALAIAVWGVLVCVAALSWRATQGRFSSVDVGAWTPRPFEGLRRVWQALESYGLQVQFTGVLFGTLQTSALLFAGIFALEASQAGLLGAASKVANFAFAVPFALSQAFILWMARRAVPAAGSFDEQVEYRRLSAVMGGVLALAVLQCLVVGAASPFLVELLSGGRWTLADQETAVTCMRLLILSTVPLIFFAVSAVWFNSRSGLMRSIWNVYLPWAAFSFAAPWLAQKLGYWAGSTAVDFVWLQLAQSAALAALLALEWGRLLWTRPPVR